MDTIALITGANRGLGFQVASQLADAGVTVIVAARRAEDAAAAARALGGTADGVQLDVRDDASVDRAAEVVAARHGRLDVLVNNAGILPEATSPLAEVVDADLFRDTFETNLLGPVRVTQRFLPLLRKAPAARIVNVSSRMGSLGDQSDPESPYHATVVPAYQASKAALNSVTVGLSKLLADTAIKVNAVCPGFVQTDLTPMNRTHAPLHPRDAAQVVVRYALAGVEAPTGGFFDEEAAVAW